jgi:hypothetical protein
MKKNRADDFVNNLKACVLFTFCAVLLIGCCPTHYSELVPPFSQPYHYPLMSPGTQYAELPPAVRRTICAETGGALIADIEKGEGAHPVAYKVLFENPVSFPPL